MKNLRVGAGSRSVLAIFLSLCFVACGGGYGGNGGGGGGGGGNPPGVPTGLTATAGNASVSLSWTATSGATSYYVKRSTTNGSGYTQVGNPSSASYNDTNLTNGTTYYYVVDAVSSYGASSDSAQVSATPAAAPPVPTGLTATPGNASVALTWNASAGATSYKVGRSTTSGGSYSTVASPTATNYTDSSVTNGTTYYYVVAAVGPGGTSANSSQVSATPASSTAVNVSIDVMTDRHSISPYVYGGAFPNNMTAISDSGTTVVRWGGNASSTYNWKLLTDNADNDYYFEDFTFCGLGVYPTCTDSDSTVFIKDVQTAGSNPLMTMGMLPWVAKSPESAGAGGNLHWTFSVSQDGACPSKVDPFNTDAGMNLQSDCATPMFTSSTPIPNAQIDRAYFPLLDDHTKACPPPGSTASTCEYRSDWAAALATAFGNSSSCPIPYFPSLTSCHFYDMDNEIDIWGGTHVDIHPNPATFDELRDTYVFEARNMKSWDAAAVRLGPVSCCWYFYWRSATGSSDTSSHGGVDFLPWWLNEVYWQDQIAGTRSLDIFDIHAYPDADTKDSHGNPLPTATLQSLATKIYRDWWDPAFPSAAQYIVSGGFSIEPLDSNPFRIPRMRAIANSTYPGTAMAFTEWSAAFAGESDFSTALGDADAYGILGRERMSLSTRWTAPQSSNANYQALKLYTNYDGAHHTFNPISVSATHNANPDLFSVYAATNAAGNSMTVVALNKDPNNAAKVTFAFNAFNASQVTTYTLSQASPTSIVPGSSQAWSSTITFQPYTATLLVISGSSTPPSSEWDLNPDTTMAPANGTVKLTPRLTSGSTSVNLNTAVFDAYEGSSACNSGSISLPSPTVSAGTPGGITLNAPASPGFCHFSVTASDGTTQGGWLLVGKPAATLTKTSGDNQTATHGTVLPTKLTVTLAPGSSGGTAGGASVFFTTSGGSLTNVQVGTEKVFTGTHVIAVTNSSGVASVTLTLPNSTGPVTVNAEGPYGLGHPVIVPFSETSN